MTHTSFAVHVKVEAFSLRVCLADWHASRRHPVNVGAKVPIETAVSNEGFGLVRAVY